MDGGNSLRDKSNFRLYDFALPIWGLVSYISRNEDHTLNGAGYAARLAVRRREKILVAYHILYGLMLSGAAVYAGVTLGLEAIVSK